MRTIYDKLNGPTTIREDTRLYGAITGTATVPAGVTLDLFGTVAGDLDVEPGGRVKLFGTVTGSVFNRGTLDVRGVIVGMHVDANGGVSSVDPGAAVLRQG